MALISNRVDDMNGTPLAEGQGETTVSIRDGRETFTFKVDLGDDNFKALLKAVQKYRDKGREVSVLSTVTATGAKSESAEIRAWAVANGHKVSDRGALPREVVNAYHDAMGDSDTDDDSKVADLTD